MASQALRTALPIPPAASAPAQKPAKTFWRRFYDHLVEAQMRRAEREIARTLIGSGERFTDEMERKIERRQRDRFAKL